MTKKKQYPVYISEEQYNQLKRLSYETGITVKTLATRAVKEHLSKDYYKQWSYNEIR